MAIKLKVKGSFDKTNKFFNRITRLANLELLENYGKLGVEALAAATPRDTGKTAESWSYKIERSRDKARIIWCNDNISDGYIVAVLIQYGHVTSGGSMVPGLDYVNPAMAPVFNRIDAEICKEMRTS